MAGSGVGGYSGDGGQALDATFNWPHEVRADRETFDVSMLFYSLSVDAWTSDLQSDNDYGLFDGFRALEQTAVARQLQVLVDVATDVTDAAIEGGASCLP